MALKSYQTIFTTYSSPMTSLVLTDSSQLTADGFEKLPDQIMYKKWLPDQVIGRHDTKTTYQVEIRYANNTNETYTFHGPPGADEFPGPVKWTRPYFDCGRSNKWLVAAVVPIADIYPRHTSFRHIEYPTFTAISVLEMDFDRIDINQCPKGKGNIGPNKFADTARCKKETTECEPIHGWGFRRGGYQCRCRPGFRLPTVVRTPFLGEILERATQEQHENGFDCQRIGWVHKMPVQWEKATPNMKEFYLEEFYEYKNYSVGAHSLHTQNMNIDQALKFILSVNAKTCKQFHPQDLILHGDIGFDAEQQFVNEAKMAVRLANFISAFLQISDPKEVYSGKRVADKPLSEDQMIGETLALVLGDTKIWSAGTFWERNKFTNRTLFAPFAYKTQLNTRKFKVEDLARLNETKEAYTNKHWFQFSKQRWSTNFDSLEKFFMKIKIRFNETGEYLKKYEHYPNFYRGVVAVTMDMLQLDINQCPDKYYVPNAFKDTHKCHRKNSYCVPILGRGFEIGSYKCECLQGYEYPFEDPITYFDGQLVEAEFSNIVNDKPTRYDMFNCRLAGATSIQASYVTFLSLILLIRIVLR
uniref:GPR158/179 extracellular domain-containing protein n=3 Tax=Timema TaxID=61471 RepID=A0A7R9NZH9_9NEOP|nr:unnamed protein product [Timema tahoe]